MPIVTWKVYAWKHLQVPAWPPLTQELKALEEEKKRKAPSKQRRRTGADEATPAPPVPSGRRPTKVALVDWTAEDEADEAAGFVGGERRQRGGRKRRKVFQQGVSNVSAPDTHLHSDGSETCNVLILYLSVRLGQ